MLYSSCPNYSYSANSKLIESLKKMDRYKEVIKPNYIYMFSR
jgi:hypothetical protein